MSTSNLITDLQDQPKTWTKGPHLVSTDPSLIPIATLNTWFASDEVYWAKPMPEPVIRQTLQSSISFGLYRQSQTQTDNSTKDETPDPTSEGLEFIGFARCITDTTTFIYLTDVFVLPSCQGLGLGSWLLACMREIIDDMPYLRRSLLFTGDWKRSVPFYEKFLGMHAMKSTPPVDGKDGEGLAVMQRRYAGFPGFKDL
ncbi:Acyl-CoA N-acyltransferase [Penicillium paradoxum]|uniref:Acyl-CoA N-acyltransferase n=1 Tax=Penicillium paradoxum TaxID=176176 RepID=UPI0025471685|nr:Acyl-CoA N-acyltransferase [Penicillium paradoxum]KAJ5788167.1 Acyl-CoA N-acyltransferase [Penicillium paradoxum]